MPACAPVIARRTDGKAVGAFGDDRSHERWCQEESSGQPSTSITFHFSTSGLIHFRSFDELRQRTHKLPSTQSTQSSTNCGHERINRVRVCLIVLLGSLAPHLALSSHARHVAHAHSLWSQYADQCRSPADRVRYHFLTFRPFISPSPCHHLGWAAHAFGRWWIWCDVAARNDELTLDEANEILTTLRQPDKRISGFQTELSPRTIQGVVVNGR